MSVAVLGTRRNVTTKEKGRTRCSPLTLAAERLALFFFRPDVHSQPTHPAVAKSSRAIGQHEANSSRRLNAESRIWPRRLCSTSSGSTEQQKHQRGEHSSSASNDLVALVTSPVVPVEVQLRVAAVTTFTTRPEISNRTIPVSVDAGIYAATARAPAPTQGAAPHSYGGCGMTPVTRMQIERLRRSIRVAADASDGRAQHAIAHR
eukprot:2040926-Prymnesium_polylepis.3